MPAIPMESSEQMLPRLGDGYSTASSAFSDDDFDGMDLVLALERDAEMTEEMALINAGYRDVHPIRCTQQGELLLGNRLTNSSSKVVIKKVSQYHRLKRILPKDESGFTLVTERDLAREGAILESVQHKHIVKFVGMLHTQYESYLVTEYIENGIPLRDFVVQCHNLMKQGKMHAKYYFCIVQRILHQLITTLQWLHDEEKCCHLDICMSNLVIQCNADSVAQCHLNDINLFVCDFSLAERFVIQEGEDEVSFQCVRHDSTANGITFASPQITDMQQYDARAADCWAFGIVLYECLAGHPLYSAQDLSNHVATQCSHCGDDQHLYSCALHALHCGRLKDYIAQRHPDFQADVIDIIDYALQIEETNRATAAQLCDHDFFRAQIEL